jgi:hypothetical protein
MSNSVLKTKAMETQFKKLIAEYEKKIEIEASDEKALTSRKHQIKERHDGCPSKYESDYDYQDVVERSISCKAKQQAYIQSKQDIQGLLDSYLESIRIPKLAAFILIDETWGGWTNSNSKGEKQLLSLRHAVAKIMVDDDYLNGYYLIDADNLKIYLSDMKHAKFTQKTALTNFGVAITDENITVGLPEL